MEVHTMKNSRFVEDGGRRLRECKGYQRRLRELHETIVAQHAAELAEAGFWGRLTLRWRMAAEFRRERRKFTPSPESYYLSRAVTAHPARTRCTSESGK
jgi:hypothetical protein